MPTLMGCHDGGWLNGPGRARFKGLSPDARDLEVVQALEDVEDEVCRVVQVLVPVALFRSRCTTAKDSRRFSEDGTVGKRGAGGIT